MAQEDAIQQAVEEARRILSQHNGIHHLHSDTAALVLMEECAKKGLQIDMEEAERILRQMRRSAAGGSTHV